MATTTESLTECRSPNCKEPPAPERRWCAEHAEIFDRVKASEVARKKKVVDAIGRKDVYPTCCREGCREPRLRGERYCEACQEEGWTEDDFSR